MSRLWEDFHQQNIGSFYTQKLGKGVGTKGLQDFKKI